MKKFICICLAILMMGMLIACEIKIEIPQKEPPKQETPDGEISGDETPDDETPGVETPDDETPGDETSDDETPGDETPDDETPGDEISEKPTFNTTDMVEFISWKSSADPTNNGIKLKSERKDVIFECTVDKGELVLGEEKGKELTAKTDDILHWFPTVLKYNYKELAFVEVRMKEGEKIVGYSLVEIYYAGDRENDDEWDADSYYQPILLESEIADDNQDFTGSYVNEKMAKAKEYMPEISDELLEQINKDYYEIMHKTPVSIFYGEYDGAMVFMSLEVLHTAHLEKIFDVKLYYVSGNVTWVWKDGAINFLYFEFDDQISDICEMTTQRDWEIIGSIHGKYCYSSETEETPKQEIPKQEKPTFNTTDMVEFISWKSSADRNNNGIKLKSEREDVIFECIVDKGELVLGEEKGKELIAKPGDVLHWFPTVLEYDYEKLAFVEIRMKEENKIVGYALVEIYYAGDRDYDEWEGGDSGLYEPVEGNPYYQPILLESEIADDNQELTVSYVNEKMAKAKEYMPELSEELIEQINKESYEKYGMNMPLSTSIFYGEYNGAMVFICTDAIGGKALDKIFDVQMRFKGGCYIWIWKDGKLYYLTSLDMNKICENMTQRDWEIIGSIHGKYSDLTNS